MIDCSVERLFLHHHFTSAIELNCENISRWVSLPLRHAPNLQSSHTQCPSLHLSLYLSLSLTLYFLLLCHLLQGTA